MTTNDEARDAPTEARVPVIEVSLPFMRCTKCSYRESCPSTATNCRQCDARMEPYQPVYCDPNAAQPAAPAASEPCSEGCKCGKPHLCPGTGQRRVEPDEEIPTEAETNAALAESGIDPATLLPEFRERLMQEFLAKEAELSILRTALTQIDRQLGREPDGPSEAFWAYLRSRGYTISANIKLPLGVEFMEQWQHFSAGYAAARTGRADISVLADLVDVFMAQAGEAEQNANKAEFEGRVEYAANLAGSSLAHAHCARELRRTLAQLKPNTPREAGIIVAGNEWRDAKSEKDRIAATRWALGTNQYPPGYHDQMSVAITRVENAERAYFNAALADDSAEGVK